MNECLECGRTLRPWGETADDYPGTVQVFARGLCRPCHSSLKTSGTLDRLYPVRTGEDGKAVRALQYRRDITEPCESCKRPMRPYGSSPEEWPDTVCRKGRVCSGCATKRAALRQRNRPAPAAAPDVRKMREDLKDWFYSRGRDWRLAGIPA